MPIIPIYIQNEVNNDAVSRVSAFNFCDPFDHILPVMDGVISISDKRHLWGIYTGNVVIKGLSLFSDDNKFFVFRINKQIFD